MNNTHTNNTYKSANPSISSICFRSKPLNSIRSEIQFRLLNQFWQQLETVCNSPKARVNTDTSDDLPLVQWPSHSWAQEKTDDSLHAARVIARYRHRQPLSKNNPRTHEPFTIISYRIVAPRCKMRFEVIVSQQYGDDTIPDIVRRVFLVKDNSRVSPGWNLR